MVYYIIPGQIFTVFLSLAHLTIINFPQKLEDYAGGQKGDYLVYELNKGKGLVFESKTRGFNKNFITFAGGIKYHFNLVYNKKYSVRDIELRQGEPCSYFKLHKETRSYQLFSCPKSLFFINKEKKSVSVNNIVIRDKGYISKGPPVFLNGKIIYFPGKLP